MTLRTTNRTVAFTRPFSMSGIDGALPAGTYEIRTEEESIDSVSFLAFRRVATVLDVTSRGETRSYTIDPAELDAALFIDGRAVQPVA